MKAKTAAFLIVRSNYYKQLAPIMLAALKRRWQVEAWYLDADQSGKPYLQPSGDQTPPELVGRITIRSFGDAEALQALVDQDGPDALFSLMPRKYHQIRMPSPCQFVIVQNGIDTFVNASPEELLESDLVCLYSAFWLDFAVDYYRADGAELTGAQRDQLEAKATFVGYPNWDVLADLDTAQIREEFYLPPEKKVVLLLPINLTYWPGEWPWFFLSKAGLGQIRQLFRATRKDGWRFLAQYWRWALAGWNDDRLVQSIREFCDNNDALLVAKAREKDALRPMTAELADLALYDEEYYPSTIYKLMKVADLCIHFYSTAALEAAYLGMPGLCIHRPNLDSTIHKFWRRSEAGTAFNFPGVNRWATIPEAIRDLPAMTFDDFALMPNARDQFVGKYLGPTDQQTSERIMDRLESSLNSPVSQKEATA